MPQIRNPLLARYRGWAAAFEGRRGRLPTVGETADAFGVSRMTASLLASGMTVRDHSVVWDGGRTGRK